MARAELGYSQENPIITTGTSLKELADTRKSAVHKANQRVLHKVSFFSLNPKDPNEGLFKVKGRRPWRDTKIRYIGKALNQESKKTYQDFAIKATRIANAGDSKRNPIRPTFEIANHYYVIRAAADTADTRRLVRNAYARLNDDKDIFKVRHKIGGGYKVTYKGEYDPNTQNGAFARSRAQHFTEMLNGRS